MVREQNKTVLHSEENLRRRFLLFFLLASGISPALPCFGKTKSKNPYDEKRLLQQNKRIQKENNAPEDFPNFIREGLFICSYNLIDFIVLEISGDPPFQFPFLTAFPIYVPKN